MRNNRPELLGDVITRVMDTLNTRRQEMCDFFDDFDDFNDEGEFDDGMEDSMDSDPEEDESDEMSWDEAFWSGACLGFAYEEGRLKRRKQKNSDSGDPSEID